MKRDVDLMRAILLAIEAMPPYAQQNVFIPEVDNETTAAHVEMMIDGGLVKGKVLHSFDGVQCMVSGLTLAGHNFLDDIRNDSVWHQTKSTILEKGGSLSMEVLKVVAGAAAKAYLGFPPG